MRWNPLALLKPTMPSAQERAGVADTPSFRPGYTQFWQPRPAYRDHLIDIYSLRTSFDSVQLIENMFRNDPDVGATVNAYLTMANTEPQIYIRDINGKFAPEAYKVWNQMVSLLTHTTDMTQGYQRKPSLRSIAEQMRYLTLLRGACAAEMVFNEKFVPSEIRLVDPASLLWFEKNPGQFKPQQRVLGTANLIDLDIPTFVHSYFRQNPNELYPYSPFVGAITTIAARQQIINDLYRILKMTGYPRLDITVMEAILKNSAPPQIASDGVKLRAWINARITDIRMAFANMKPDEAFVHTDATAVKMANEKSSGVAINMDSVIEVLNSQNQAGLRVMGTIIGRGESGVNTASVEARVFSMNADELNVPVGDTLSKLFTTGFQILGFPVFVQIVFPPSELRPATELEAQLVTRQARLLEALSLGLITDDEFHMKMYGRLPPDKSPTLMGTGFWTAVTAPVPNDGQPGSVQKAVTPSGPKNPDKSKAVNGPGK